MAAIKRCLQCKVNPAVMDMPRHRTRLCGDCYIDFVRAQVRTAIREYRMLRYDQRILVAVSGGKDSLALWDILLDMGYNVDGLYLGLGIGGYSSRSEQIVRDFAERRGVVLHVERMEEAYGFDIPATVQAAKKDRHTRSACGTCGLAKRYAFNQVALVGEYDIMATGHNLDDEASQLFGNVMRWQTDFLARQSPSLPASPGELAAKVKPLYRLTEKEMAAYCVIKGLNYVVEECPLVKGNTQMMYKEMLNAMEHEAPGAKAAFLFGYLDRVREPFFGDAAAQSAASTVPCQVCGMPTVLSGDRTEATCAFCRTRSKMLTVLNG
ncbi:ATP-binding protein [Stomatohabitans albus]|uniref:ATP-binding protein n=1 Tax=Stomatohabitans albus TaxID=3110766 RepID=UPI003AB955C3